MNPTASCRAAVRSSLLVAVLVAHASAQEDTAAKGASPESIAQAMRARESEASSAQLELETVGAMAGGLSFVARGSVRVQRIAEPPEVRMHTKVVYEFGDGLTGSVETVQTADGVWTLQQDPTFGESFVRIDPTICKDLEWAASAMSDGEVPFRGSPRAFSPLGAEMFEDLVLRFDLRTIDKAAPEGQKGTWFAGERKLAKGTGIQAEGADLPIADRVEAFVRDDLVLADAQFTLRGEVVQRIRVTRAVLGAEIGKDAFRIDAGGKKPVEAKDHPPTWQQIEQALQRATQKKGGELPPSRR